MDDEEPLSVIGGESHDDLFDTGLGISAGLSDYGFPDNNESDVFGDSPNVQDIRGFVIRTNMETSLASPAASQYKSSTGVVKRRPIPRKGHTKSRRGCFNCKARKIKCQETRPCCSHCVKAGLQCQYPNPRPPIQMISSPESSVSSIGKNLQSTPTTFTVKDMQFFHHFLTRGYPHLPLGADNLWTKEIPKLAHEYDYLLHAMLALGASNMALGSDTPSDLIESGLSHRVEAVKRLNKAIATRPKDKFEADVRFATLMALTFQSSCMVDGLSDFLTMLRGCVLSGAEAYRQDSFFINFLHQAHLAVMDERFSQTQLDSLDRKPLEQAAESLEALAPLCTDSIDIKFHAVLVELIKQAYFSPRNSYYLFTCLYNIFGTQSAEDFQHLIDPSNHISQILVSHFLAVHWIMRPITRLESPLRDASPLYSVMQSWVLTIHANLDKRFRALNAWPLAFIDSASSPFTDIKRQIKIETIDDVEQIISKTTFQDVQPVFSHTRNMFPLLRRALSTTITYQLGNCVHQTQSLLTTMDIPHQKCASTVKQRASTPKSDLDTR
ncbi:hypothetical protein BT63DRAFT_461137 [Microthyrium microscopicum]|uniref:Zn(2)-C6 fungal-type domain-containing protein n=1 Tax=Microthyrium microscopicum TaxID=703497 RepID=A0A6A6TTL8_9PEZI|nr:hypothetical protein BT63DRAFT_461137 [Microthyrium microscopicum]